MTESKPTVAALFVDPKGVYANRPDVDAWDESRDARSYRGHLPVVAPPPCNRWVNLAALNYARWGGEHNRPGNDGGCFASALWAARANGGVIEHPAFSNAWRHFGLQRPIDNGQWHQVSVTEWVCEVWQVAYGHKCRKRTWLYYVGRNSPTQMIWTHWPGTHQCGWFDRKKPTLSKRKANATPPAFAEALLALARNCGGSN